MNVEIWSDIVCPWCYIGKRRFETALAGFAHRDEVTVLWRSFELNPEAPRRYPGTLDKMLAQKMGVSAAQAAAMNTQVTGLAGAEGLTYRLDRAQYGNTFDAHRLLHFAAHRGLQAAVKERLLSAYFRDGLAIGDAGVLAEIVSEVGVDANEARAVLAGDDYAGDVRADERRAALLGIRGVPFVLIDEHYAVSGAQTPEVFLRALNEAWTASRALVTVTGTDDANSCRDESCVLPS